MNGEARLKEAAFEILSQNLGLKSEERYLFFTDFNSDFEDEEMLKRRVFLHHLFEAFSALSNLFPHGSSDKYESTRRHGSEPGENLWRLAFGDTIYSTLLRWDYIWRLKAEADFSDIEWRMIHKLIRDHKEQVVDALIAFPWYSVTHTRFRRLLTQAGTRIVSMPMLTPRVMDGPMVANWGGGDLVETTEKVYEILLASRSLRLSCPKGSDLSLALDSPDQIHTDTGSFKTPGAFGNLPAGEAYLVPKPDSANGRVVLTSGPDHPTIEDTVVLIEKGQVVGFERETPYSEVLDEKFREDFRIRHLAELGIGTNPLATDVSSMVEGEKIQGTVHIAFGDDSSIGGANEATQHLDHIIVNPTLVAELKDGGQVRIVSSGRLTVS